MALNPDGEYLLEELFTRSVNENGVLADIAVSDQPAGQPIPPDQQQIGQPPVPEQQAGQVPQGQPVQPQPAVGQPVQGQQGQQNQQPVQSQPVQPAPVEQPKTPPKPSDSGIIEDPEDPKAHVPLGDEDEATGAKRKLFLAQRWKLRENIARQVKTSGLDDLQKTSVMEVVQDVLDRMPRMAIQEFDDGVHEIMFHPDQSALASAVGADGPVATCYVRGGEHGGVLHLVVGGEEATGIYLHGIGHAVDGSLHASEGPEWQAAWQAEVSNQSLSAHGATNAAEGFAEFCRYAWSGLPKEEIVQAYPQCSAVFESLKLL